jgi:hypothetical protein
MGTGHCPPPPDPAPVAAPVVPEPEPVPEPTPVVPEPAPVVPEVEDDEVPDLVDDEDVPVSRSSALIEESLNATLEQPELD